MLRYYPSSKVIEDQKTSGGEFLLKGKTYSGKYYITYDGKAYSGQSPETGPSELLTRDETPNRAGSSNPNVVSIIDVNKQNKEGIANTHTDTRITGQPMSHQPSPSESDYNRGYLIRYFTKKENEKGFIIEISQEEYNSIVNGTADFDIRMYQVCKILWKLTGPLKSQRQSQYNVIPGIVETNQRLTETTNKNFLGIVDFIGGEYSKFARPTP